MSWTRCGWTVRISAVLAVLAASVVASPTLDAQQTDGYARASSGTRELTLGSGTSIKMLFDAANLGSGEIEVAEIVFPAGGSSAAGHRHGAIEIFYVVEGVLGHVVNGVESQLRPGMAGVVKPGDEVVHRVIGDQAVKALVLWVPGGEADRIAPAERWTPLGG
jgi:mannose-6-phosphate isomerase-like protein (cupin superfamily)